MTHVAPRLPQDARACSSSASARCANAADPLGAPGAQARRPVSRSRLPAARFVDRHPRRTTPPRSTSARPICGQGTGTAFRQMMADELDIAYDKTTCVMGSTDVTVDQGGSGGSDAIQTDGWPMRRVAAEARRVLLEMASHALRRAGRRSSRSATASIIGDGRSVEARHLRRADRRQAVQRRADRQQHRRDHRRRRR